MTKKELLNNGWEYISTKCDTNIDIYAKFSGLEDVIQYYYYDSINDSTIGLLMTITYGMIDLFRQMENKLNIKFCNMIDDKYNNFFYDKERGR